MHHARSFLTVLFLVGSLAAQGRPSQLKEFFAAIGNEPRS